MYMCIYIIYVCVDATTSRKWRANQFCRESALYYALFVGSLFCNDDPVDAVLDYSLFAVRTLRQLIRTPNTIFNTVDIHT